MKRLIALSLILAPASGTAQPTPEDAGAVLAAVLAQEAAVRGPESGAQTCVAAALAGPPIAPGGESGMALDRAVRIFFQWHVPPPPAVVRPPRAPDAPGRPARRPRIEPVPPPAALASAEADRLNALREEAAGAPVLARGTRIDDDVVPAPLHVQRANEDCALLMLSAPAFAGGAAFVEVGYVCGTVCGNGSLYAIERRDGRWQVVGIADIWIR